MAFGFTPKFEQSVDLYGFDPTHYLAIALDVVNQFGWSVNYTSKSGLIAFTGTSIFSTSEKITVLIKDNTVNITSENAGSGMYDWGRNKKNVENFITEFDAACARLSAEQIEIMATGLKPQIETDEEDRLALPPPTAADNFKSFFSLFIPRPGYTISPIIVDLNILVFIVMAISGVSLIEPDSQDLLNWGANLRGATLSGQWWRLFTNTFIHIGFLHLLLNMYALLYIGVLLEPYLGKLKFATAYLFTGIIASLTSCYWHPVTISAGASGAIFGMYGVFLAMLTTNFIPKALRKPLLTSIGVFVAFNLMNGVKAGIDNAAHIGGLISGLAIGYIYYPSLKKPLLHGLSYLTIGIVSVLFLITSITIYKQIPDDMVRYNAKIKEFLNYPKILRSLS